MCVSDAVKENRGTIAKRAPTTGGPWPTHKPFRLHEEQWEWDTGRSVDLRVDRGSSCPAEVNYQEWGGERNLIGQGAVAEPSVGGVGDGQDVLRQVGPRSEATVPVYAAGARNCARIVLFGSFEKPVPVRNIEKTSLMIRPKPVTTEQRKQEADVRGSQDQLRPDCSGDQVSWLKKVMVEEEASKMESNGQSCTSPRSLLFAIVSTSSAYTPRSSPKERLATAHGRQLADLCCVKCGSRGVRRGAIALYRSEGADTVGGRSRATEERQNGVSEVADPRRYDDVRWKRFVTAQFFAFGLISQRGVIDALLADLQNTVPGQHQHVGGGGSSVPGYGSLNGVRNKQTSSPQAAYQTSSTKTITETRGANGYGNGSLPRSTTPHHNNSLPRSSTPQQQKLPGSASGNLSELDSLLQDLSSARYGNIAEKHPPNNGTTSPSPYAINDSIKRPSVDSLLDELSNANQNPIYAVPYGNQSPNPTQPGRQVTITVRETTTEKLTGTPSVNYQNQSKY
ncbi:paxillin [Culex quinquefasciatus]|uniref:Paxillin n=1 Tax=Culex quinquefasciatus TaxID=7176 RepID=B0WWN1_CULQU|nr:paxillin [Culex quinquefasciatus]|eukprot:XP_001861803.1 paxillin [Culex quinquefasciatus]